MCLYKWKIIEFNSDCSIRLVSVSFFAVFGRNDFLFAIKVSEMAFLCVNSCVCQSYATLRLNCMPHCHHASLQSSNQLISINFY